MATVVAASSMFFLGAVLVVKSLTIARKKTRQGRYRPMGEIVPSPEEVSAMGKESILEASEKILTHVEEAEDEEVLLVWREAATRSRNEFSSLL